MSESNPCFAAPSPEHARLTENVGAWNVDCTYHMGGEIMHCKATDTCRAIGPFWTVSTFESDFNGMPFHGVATTGFDPDAKHYVATWVDSFNPRMSRLHGQVEDGVLRMTGTAVNGMTGKPMVMRSEEQSLGDGRRSFKMWMDGELAMEYVYSRA